MTNNPNCEYEVNIERYVDIKRVSRYTSLPVKTIYDWSNQGKFPCIKYGRRILFDLQDVDKAMASLKRPYLQHEKTANKIIGDLHGNGIY
jgi:excisionase family DNA binding protein